jgi:ParB family chromosome partitioning protein
MDITEIPIHKIDEDTDQPRNIFDEESLQELMKSIEELGLLSPIKVRTTPGGRYKIIYGNRRYKACKTLGLQAIPCIVSTATDELEIYLEQIAENLTREGFSPIEEAEAFHKLMNDPKFSSSIKYLSSKLGKPEAYIKNKCDLLNFGDKIKKLVVSGTEIKKDRLTEEQLMPIKDLPIEHRDPLAMIIAKDELPVSDVKKIARLFKDKDMSSGTKDKLLYKSGHELLQTWSVFEQNKAERTKSTAPKTTAAKEKPEKKADDQKKVAPFQVQLQQWLTSFSETATLPTYALDINHQDTAYYLNEVNLLIENLEKHLNAWKKVKYQIENDISNKEMNL